MSLLEYKKLLIDLPFDINSILSKYGINEKISKSDLAISKKTITDSIKEKSKLSDALINFLWPRISSEVVYHYTSMEAAENILSSNIFRLYNIVKRYSENEIETFCKEFKLNGYLEKDKDGYPMYKSIIMPNTFFASFTDTEIDLKKEKEEYLWNEFATEYGQREGARLKIEIYSSMIEFRKMRYKIDGDVSIKILSELFDLIQIKYKRKFIFKGLSTLCSFYLPKIYSVEEEYRVIYRIWDDSKFTPKSDGENYYIEFPIYTDKKSGYQFKLKEIHANKKPQNIGDKCKFSKRKNV